MLWNDLPLQPLSAAYYLLLPDLTWYYLVSRDLTWPSTWSLDVISFVIPPGQAGYRTKRCHLHDVPRRNETVLFFYSFLFLKFMQFNPISFCSDPAAGAGYCAERVCVSVCLPADTCEVPYTFEVLQFFLLMLPVAQSSFGIVTIRYVLPVCE